MQSFEDKADSFMGMDRTKTPRPGPSIPPPLRAIAIARGYHDFSQLRIAPMNHHQLNRVAIIEKSKRRDV